MSAIEVDSEYAEEKTGDVGHAVKAHHHTNTPGKTKSLDETDGHHKNSGSFSRVKSVRTQEVLVDEGGFQDAHHRSAGRVKSVRQQQPDEGTFTLPAEGTPAAEALAGNLEFLLLYSQAPLLHFAAMLKKPFLCYYVHLP
jgi:hypothetical protein